MIYSSICFGSEIRFATRKRRVCSKLYRGRYSKRQKTANSGEKPSKMTENEIKTVKNDGKSPFPTIAYKAVYDALIENPKAKYEQLEIYLGLSESSIQRAIKWMKENGYIDAEHSKVIGIWQIR